MIRSMTAFARRTRDLDGGMLVWELRSVNHRYLELALRLPEDLRSLEPVLRERAGRRLKRGKVELVLRLRGNLRTPAAVEIDDDLLDQVMQACRHVSERAQTAAVALDPVEVLRWPGVVRENPPDTGPLAAVALEAFDEALAELAATREREGGRLREMLLQRLDTLGPLVGRVRARQPEVRQAIRERLEGRLAELAARVDQDRVEQELVMLAQRMDVEEELDRLDAHIAEARRILDGDGAVGRRLDFLMQEFNREANTLASKSADTETTAAAVEMKVLIEQMREQVQNIE